MVLKDDTCHIKNLDFVSDVSGPAAQWGQARTLARASIQATLHMQTCWGPRLRQTVMFNKGF